MLHLGKFGHCELISTLTFDEIALKYGLSRRTITRINQGQTHQIYGLQYPLRPIDTTEIKFCIDCGIQITSKATRCDKCARVASRICNRPSREELKDLIRNKPFTQIGKQFGVSDNAIRKWCDAENLPRKASEIKSYSDEEWKVI